MIGFSGGRASGQISIRGDIRAGRTEDQHPSMMIRVMQEVSAIATVPEQDIWAYVCNLDPTDMIEYGHVLPRPGEEGAWYDSSPKSLQDYLQSLGTDKSRVKL